MSVPPRDAAGASGAPPQAPPALQGEQCRRGEETPPGARPNEQQHDALEHDRPLRGRLLELARRVQENDLDDWRRGVAAGSGGGGGGGVNGVAPAGEAAELVLRLADLVNENDGGRAPRVRLRELGLNVTGNSRRIRERWTKFKERVQQEAAAAARVAAAPVRTAPGAEHRKSEGGDAAAEGADGAKKVCRHRAQSPGGSGVETFPVSRLTTLANLIEDDSRPPRTRLRELDLNDHGRSGRVRERWTAFQTDVRRAAELARLYEAAGGRPAQGDEPSSSGGGTDEEGEAQGASGESFTLAGGEGSCVVTARGALATALRNVSRIGELRFVRFPPTAECRDVSTLVLDLAEIIGDDGRTARDRLEELGLCANGRSDRVKERWLKFQRHVLEEAAKIRRECAADDEGGAALRDESSREQDAGTVEDGGGKLAPRARLRELGVNGTGQAWKNRLQEQRADGGRPGGGERRERGEGASSSEPEAERAVPLLSRDPRAQSESVDASQVCERWRTYQASVADEDAAAAGGAAPARARLAEPGLNSNGSGREVRVRLAGGGVTPPGPLFDYYLCLDVESTCESERNWKYLNEIIEWPVVMVDAKIFETPTVKKNISEFCSELTGIDQATVDTAPLFGEVMKEFERWLRGHNLVLPGEVREGDAGGRPPPRRAVFVTDGPWDLRDHVRKTMKLNPDIPKGALGFLSGPAVDVRELFRLARPAPSASSSSSSRPRLSAVCGGSGSGPTLAGMLRELGLTFQGRPHSGLADARNVARVLEGLARAADGGEGGALSGERLAAAAVAAAEREAFRLGAVGGG